MSSNHDKLYQQRKQCIAKNNKSKDKKEIKERRWKRKVSSLNECNSISAKRHYGKESMQTESDVSEEELTKLKNKFQKNNIELTTSEIIKIEKDTKMQVCSKKWKDERRKRFTASNLGNILKENPILKTRRKCSQLKFLGRRISHEWIEEDNSSKWYSGTVTAVLTELDRADGAEYEVLYDGDDEPHILHYLLEDYRSCSLKCLDVL
ncbi:unnamed protein product [Mytilus coruscus]|uniref:Uncharacterized protein n=1 Tax=Mytilus coruscus TaxID=42192 RepID=A0A6J8C0U6_MYTCO|nr:unnamed protein product [Mytilus coruscus]